MSKLEMSTEHRLGRDEARRRIARLLDKLRDLGGAWSHRWSGESCLTFKGEVNGHAVTGNLTVQDASVDAIVTVPWSLALFAGRIRSAVERSARQLLSES